MGAVPGFGRIQYIPILQIKLSKPELLLPLSLINVGLHRNQKLSAPSYLFLLHFWFTKTHLTIRIASHCKNGVEVHLANIGVM